MSSFAGRNDRVSNELAGQGKGARTMTTQANTINRRRWLRIMTAVMGVLLFSLQALPAMAGNAALDNLSYRLGKEETGYEYIQAKSVPGLGQQLTLGAPASGPISFGAAAAGSADRIGTLQGAVDALRGSQEPADDAAKQPAEASTGDTPNDDTELAQAGEPELMIRDDFDNSGNSPIWTGESNGNEAFVDEEGGWYVMLVQPGVMLPVLATGEMEITDGAIVADARFYGEGAGDLGVIGRSATDYSVYYYCMIDVYGGAGCHLRSAEGWTELFSVAPGEITRGQMDRLVLEISNDTLTFAVNDEVVGTINDAGLTGGSWGLATSCYEGSCSGNFDFVDVYSYSGLSNEAPMSTVIATEFDGEQADSFFTGEGDWGFASINDGWYTVSLAPGVYFPNGIAGTENVTDATMTADVAIDGDGAIGLVARLSYNDNGDASYYVCWVNSYAFSNCHVVVDGTWYEIEGAEGADVTLEEINRLSLGIMGEQLVFAVNGQVVADVTDSTLQSGAMGFYHDAFADASQNFNSFVDAVNVETIGGGSASGAVIGSDLNADNDLGLYTGSGDWGFADFAYEGVYTVETNPGWIFANPIADTAFIESGVMTTVVDFGGYGSTGLIARHSSTDAGSSYYVCWVDTDAYAGCNVVVNDEWFSLGSTDQPLQLGEMSELSLMVTGSEISFFVDGVVVVETVDETLVSGDWGFFNDAYDGGEGSWADTDLVIIEQF